MSQVIPSKEDCDHTYFCIYRHPTSDVRCLKCDNILTHAEHIAYKTRLADEFISGLPTPKPYLDQYHRFNDDGRRVDRDPAIVALDTLIEREMRDGYNSIELVDLIHGRMRLTRARINLKMLAEASHATRGAL